MIHPKTFLKPPIPLPPWAFYPIHHRYRADSLLRYLQPGNSTDTVVIGLTEKDISTTKGNVTDWGIMGLAYRPGNVCVVSSYRLSKADRQRQLYKVAIHELGHTQGLPHCRIPACYMRDAAGGNPLNEEHGFCGSCRQFLVRRGWQLTNLRPDR